MGFEEGARMSPMMHMRLKLGLIAGAFVATMVAVSWPAYHRIRVNTQEAEAKIMLGYLSALQAAHFNDYGTYQEFSDPYGAMIDGKESCVMPEGAKNLGFRLKGCERRRGKLNHRYVYRVYPVVNPDTGAPDIKVGYLAEAVSGSDIEGKSLVCAAGLDRWQIGPDRVPRHIQACDF
jgi:hypothetical protein